MAETNLMLQDLQETALLGHCFWHQNSIAVATHSWAVSTTCLKTPKFLTKMIYGHSNPIYIHPEKEIQERKV